MMKIKLSLLTVLLTLSTVFGQSFEKLLYSKKDQATYLINKNIIANFEMIKQIPNSKIVKMEVMKSSQKGVDQNATTYPNLSEYGLILTEMTFENLETKTQNEIRAFLGLDSKTNIYVDGFLLMKDEYRIATKSIKEIELINPNEQDLNEAPVINVWTLNKEARLGSLHIQRNKIPKNNNDL